MAVLHLEGISTMAPVLAHCDFERELTLKTDAFDLELEAVLHQSDGKDHLIWRTLIIHENQPRRGIPLRAKFSAVVSAVERSHAYGSDT